MDGLVDVIRSTNADIAVAVGGGSTIDAVKPAGRLAGTRWANCPTVASTDGPCSALSPDGTAGRQRWAESTVALDSPCRAKSRRDVQHSSQASANPTIATKIIITVTYR